MKYLSNGFIILALVTGCNTKTGSRKLAGFSVLLNGEKTIVISCVRCNCVIEELNKIIGNQPGLLNGYSFIGDTTCTEGFLWRHKIIQYNQKQLDDISTDFYNLLIIKKTSGNEPKIKLVKTEESFEMKKYL
jgi:hypothetical protein